jgi:hypothetical protein
MLSAALGSLAELHALEGSTRHRRLALDCCLAGLIAWPFGDSAKDFRRMLQLGKDLLAATAFQDRPLQWFLESGRFPFDLAWQSRAFTDARVQEVSTLLNAE